MVFATNVGSACAYSDIRVAISVLSPTRGPYQFCKLKITEDGGAIST